MFLKATAVIIELLTLQRAQLAYLLSHLGRGQVEYTGYMVDGHGYTVVVDHGDGLKSLYAHMGKINVGTGNEVDSSTSVGSVGLTGRTTGAHLHLEINDNGIAV